jgi:hypothetical protein
MCKESYLIDDAVGIVFFSMLSLPQYRGRRQGCSAMPGSDHESCRLGEVAEQQPGGGQGLGGR